MADTTTTTTSGPPPWMVPYLQDYMARAQGVANTGYKQSPGTYTGPNAALQNSWQMFADVANNPGVMQPANNLMQKTLSGDFLNKTNPYLNSQIQQAQGDVVQAWNNVAKPAWEKQMAGSGSYGNAGVMQATGDAQNKMQRNLGDIASNMRFNAYNAERGNMMAALGMAPAMQSASYLPAQMMNQIGAQAQGFNQQQADQNYRWWQEAQQFPQQKLDAYGRALGMNTGNTQTNTQPGVSPWSSMIGGALTGAQLFDWFGK